MTHLTARPRELDVLEQRLNGGLFDPLDFFLDRSFDVDVALVRVFVLVLGCLGFGVDLCCVLGSGC